MLAEWRAGDATAGDDATDVAWATPSEMASYELPDLQIDVITKAARQRRSAV